MRLLDRGRLDRNAPQGAHTLPDTSIHFALRAHGGRERPRCDLELPATVGDPYHEAEWKPLMS
jgi:hypothetical protein